MGVEKAKSGISGRGAPCSGHALGHDAMRMIFLAAVSLAYVLPLAAAASGWQDPSGMQDYFDPNYSADPRRQWFRLAMAAVGVCLFANVLVYVAAKVFHMPNWEKFAVSEFYQVTVSALLITSAVWLLGEGFDYMMKYVLPSASTTQCMGQTRNIYGDPDYPGPIKMLQCKIEEKLEYVYKLFNQAVKVNDAFEPLTTININLFNLPIFNGDWMVPEWHNNMEKAHVIANRVTPLAINLEGQYMFMDYIANNMLTMLLPLGIILRIIPVFRGIGGFLMAVAIGFYIVFPLAYLMLDPTTVRASPEKMINTALLPKKACYNTFSGTLAAATQVSQAGGNPSTVNTNSNLVNSIDITQVSKEIGRLQIEIIFYPLTALAVAIVFIQAAAPFLGGDSGEITHFVLKVI